MVSQKGRPWSFWLPSLKCTGTKCRFSGLHSDRPASATSRSCLPELLFYPAPRSTRQLGLGDNFKVAHFRHLPSRQQTFGLEVNIQFLALPMSRCLMSTTPHLFSRAPLRSCSGASPLQSLPRKHGSMRSGSLTPMSQLGTASWMTSSCRATRAGASARSCGYFRARCV